MTIYFIFISFYFISYFLYKTGFLNNLGFPVSPIPQRLRTGDLILFHNNRLVHTHTSTHTHTHAHIQHTLKLLLLITPLSLIYTQTPITDIKIYKYFDCFSVGSRGDGCCERRKCDAFGGFFFFFFLSIKKKMHILLSINYNPSKLSKII